MNTPNPSVSLSLSSAARERFLTFLKREPDALAVRFGAKRTGCSGYGYTIELAHSLDQTDVEVEVEGVPFVLNRQHLALLEGTFIDFHREGINARFVFQNPNAVGACGCGESFTVTHQS